MSSERGNVDGGALRDEGLIQRGRLEMFLEVHDLVDFLCSLVPTSAHTHIPQLSHHHPLHHLIMSSDGYELLCLENPLLDILGTNDLTNHAKNCD